VLLTLMRIKESRYLCLMNVVVAFHVTLLKIDP
jgi:hypothetical protein